MGAPAYLCVFEALVVRQVLLTKQLIDMSSRQSQNRKELLPLL